MINTPIRTDEFMNLSNLSVYGLDEGMYEDDPEMMLILHRLSLASMNAEVRQVAQTMNINADEVEALLGD